MEGTDELPIDDTAEALPVAHPLTAPAEAADLPVPVVEDEIEAVRANALPALLDAREWAPYLVPVGMASWAAWANYDSEAMAAAVRAGVLQLGFAGISARAVISGNEAMMKAAALRRGLDKACAYAITAIVPPVVITAGVYTMHAFSGATDPVLTTMGPAFGASLASLGLQANHWVFGSKDQS